MENPFISETICFAGAFITEKNDICEDVLHEMRMLYFLSRLIFQCLLYHLLPSGSESEASLRVRDGKCVADVGSIKHSPRAVLR